MNSENNSFWQTFARLLVMVVVSLVVWLGLRYFQTDITPVAKPTPKVASVHETKPHG